MEGKGLGELVRNKSDWDYQKREDGVNKDKRKELIRLMMQQDDPKTRIELAKLIYQL